MPTHPIQLPQELYERLHAQAAQFQLTPEQFIERLLADERALGVMAGDDLDVAVPLAGSDEALAAAQRLTTLFADVVIPDLDQALADPMIALAHADAAADSGDS